MSAVTLEQRAGGVLNALKAIEKIAPLPADPAPQRATAEQLNELTKIDAELTKLGLTIMLQPNGKLGGQKKREFAYLGVTPKGMKGCKVLQYRNSALRWLRTAKFSFRLDGVKLDELEPALRDSVPTPLDALFRALQQVLERLQERMAAGNEEAFKSNLGYAVACNMRPGGYWIVNVYRGRVGSDVALEGAAR